MDSKPDITKTRRLPRQQKGGMPLMLSRAITNLVLAVCESFMNLRVIVPITDSENVLSVQEADVKITELGAVVTMPALSTGGGGGGGEGGGGCQQFKIVSDGGDYWVVKSWDGTTLGAVTQNIVKPYKLRAGTAKIASEVIRGVTYTYTYTAVTVGSVTGYYTRAVAGSDGSSETDYVIPDALGNDIIYATSCLQPTVAVPDTLLTVTLVNPGTGGTYAPNDVLTVAGGTGTAATIKVLTVSAGKIVTWQLLTSGSYTTAPTLSANAVTGGGGSGATFNLTLAPLLLDVNMDGRAWTK